MTRSGKCLNPTDQARKEARRRELKRNRKQRLIVRQSVLKTKHPEAVMRELQQVDEMEFDPVNVLNLKMLQDKRRKLKEIWDRVLKLYTTENPQKAEEMKQIERKYDSRRMELCAYYESVQQAKKVRLEEIHMPEGPEPPQHHFLTLFTKSNTQLPPGPPPGAPTLLTDEEEDYEKPSVRLSTRFSDAPPPGLTTFIAAATAAAQHLNPPVRIVPVAEAAAAIAKNAIIASTECVASSQIAAAAVVGTIEAKPQITNKLVQVTKMVPTVVKLKKNNNQDVSKKCDEPPSQTDHAYEQFMREIGKLM